MSSSLSGCGLPLSMLLIKDEVDHTWPVQHAGAEKTDIAFAAAVAAIDIYWRDCILSGEVQRLGELARCRLNAIACYYGGSFSVRGGGWRWDLIARHRKLQKRPDATPSREVYLLSDALRLVRSYNSCRHSRSIARLSKGALKYLKTPWQRPWIKEGLRGLNLSGI